MRQSIRSELHKALHNKMLLIAIMIGSMCCVLDMAENAGKIQEFDETVQRMADLGLRFNTGHEGYSLFYLWMGIGRFTRGANLFCTIWPVLAAMAYGWSYSSERRTGVTAQIMARCGKRSYFASKYIAVFVSGGLAVAVPLLLGLLGNALVCPYAEISPVFGVISDRDFLSELFYYNHWLYGICWCGMVFLQGGVAACLCFVAGHMLRYMVMVILVPFALYLAWDAVVSTFGSTLFKDVNLPLSVYRLTIVMPGFSIPTWYLFAVLGFLTAISFAAGYWWVVKRDVL